MKKSILFVLVGLALSQTAFAASTAENKAFVKNSAPNQYDCTIDELELFITKRTEDLRRDNGLTAWEDFKIKAHNLKKANKNGHSSESGGDASSEALHGATGSSSGTTDEEDDCPLFFSDLNDLPPPPQEDDKEKDNILNVIASVLNGGALEVLQKQAANSIKNLSKTLTDTLKKGICKRLSTEHLTELGTSVLDKNMKEKFGYTTKNIQNGTFVNNIVNDSLQSEYGDSNAKLINLLDPRLDRHRDNLIKRIVKNSLDGIEDGVTDSLDK